MRKHKTIRMVSLASDETDQSDTDQSDTEHSNVKQKLKDSDISIGGGKSNMQSSYGDFDVFAQPETKKAKKRCMIYQKYSFNIYW